MKWLVLMSAVALLICGCGEDGPEPACIRGSSVACVGPGGCSGGQACLADGTGFGSCDCDPAGDGGPDCSDSDGDGYDDAQCGGDDCDDSNGAVHPGADEQTCNGIDDDCDGLLAAAEDEDRDGSPSMSCGGDDCDDADPTRFPAAPELCDRIDNDCDGASPGEDLDQDGHLPPDASCSGGVLGALPRDDCDDDDGTRSPSATESCNVMDDDCDGNVDEACSTCIERVPTGDFGATPGRNLGGFTLQACDGSPYSFYNEEFCQAEVTVINIAAGWCPPCIAESMQLETEINDFYAGQGVRVIQILIQTADYSAPDLAYCQGWVDRFGLSNIELIDPATLTDVFFPDNSLPASLIIDREGLIRFRENGASDGLSSLKAAIDEVLLGP